MLLTVWPFRRRHVFRHRPRPRSTGPSDAIIERLETRTLPAVISGQVFRDLIGDGVKQPDFPVLSDWTIFLDSNGNTLLDAGEDSRTTDADGRYRFDDLPPGTYSVRQVLV